MKKSKIGIVGLGFVGSAVETGFDVIAEIRSHDKFKPSESLQAVISHSDIVFVCLPTPMNEDGSCDTSIIESSIEEINSLTKKRKTIVIKSTVPPGTTAKLQKKFSKHLFVFNPEFLTEKNFIHDFLNQKFIVLGFEHSEEKLDLERQIIEFYHNFTKTQRSPGYVSIASSDEAEMMKYMINTFLATKVMFFNEMYQICEAMKIPYENVADLAMLDSRIGTSHTKVPGHDGDFGFGGSCFPKDLNSLIAIANNHDVDPLLLETVWTKNLLVRKDRNWEKLAQVTGKYKKKKNNE